MKLSDLKIGSWVTDEFGVKCQIVELDIREGIAECIEDATDWDTFTVDLYGAQW